MTNTKRIVSIDIIKPGSNPDVDSDINTEYRDRTLEHVTEIYGKDNVANIVTFNTLAAKGAFKEMCTIYNIPFSASNKIAALIPPPIEGVECTIDDIFNPKSDRYAEGADFRTATAEEYWQKIIEGAREIEGRNKSTGLHPCGIVISSKPLDTVIPLHVRESDNRVITQWKYEECESLGLIKMDFLGLDTVDLIQHTVEYIQKSGKKVPNMIEIIHGDMKDKKTLDLVGRGDTIGVFQLASPGVQDLLKRIKPTSVDDIIATTALYRPGPMGMQSHIKYADRKNNREPVTPIHKDFVGSPLDKILEKTWNLVVYQEQILQISNQIAGMTLQEGDDLRKAMGKKIVEKMMKMKPKFIEGGKKNGYSEEAMNILWDTISEFAKYGFNKSHSVAYGINAYQAAYLKANYPVEFMAALIAQNIGSKDKILSFLQEARRMGLKVGSVEINTSEVKVSPDYSGNSGFDIVYGLGGINAVSNDMAQIIVTERKKNGHYKSVQDLINRCTPLGINNKKIYENLALAGAFDNMGVSRKAVVENLSVIMNQSKSKEAKGSDLFDMFGMSETTESASIKLEGLPEYPFVEKLKQEANVIGLYLTDHPLSKAGPGLSKMRNITIQNLLKSKETVNVYIAGSVTEIISKTRRAGGKSMMITIDDGTGYLSANLSRDIVKGIDKFVAQEKIKNMYISGADGVPEELEEIATSEFKPIQTLEKNSVYIINLTFRPSFGETPYGARVNSIRPLVLADNGMLPVRIRYHKVVGNEDHINRVKGALPRTLHNKLPGEYPIFTAEYDSLSLSQDDIYYVHAISEMKSLKGSSEEKKVWPPEGVEVSYSEPESILEKADAIELLHYVDSGYTTDKNGKVEQAIEKFLGVESYDFGVFDPSILE